MALYTINVIYFIFISQFRQMYFELRVCLSCCHCRNCKTFGAQSWIASALIITEMLVALKFDWDTITKPLPRPVAIVWIVGLTGLALWTLWHFYLQRLLFYTEYKLTVKEVNRTGDLGGVKQGHWEDRQGETQKPRRRVQTNQK